jgi:hypothetical protein
MIKPPKGSHIVASLVPQMVQNMFRGNAAILDVESPRGDLEPIPLVKGSLFFMASRVTRPLITLRKT